MNDVKKCCNRAYILPYPSTGWAVCTSEQPCSFCHQEKPQPSAYEKATKFREDAEKSEYERQETVLLDMIRAKPQPSTEKPKPQFIEEGWKLEPDMNQGSGGWKYQAEPWERVLNANIVRIGKLLERHLNSHD